MNRHAASTRCAQLWHHLGLPYTKILRKSVVDRYCVGYFGHYPNNHVVIMGVGSTWEEAFERAMSKESK